MVTAIAMDKKTSNRQCQDLPRWGQGQAFFLSLHSLTMPYLVSNNLPRAPVCVHCKPTGSAWPTSQGCCVAYIRQKCGEKAHTAQVPLAGL